MGRYPEGWTEKPLKFADSFSSDSLSESTPANYHFRYVDIGSVSNEWGIESYTEMDFGGCPSRARKRVHVGDTIVSTVRTYLKAIALIEDSNDIIVSTGFSVIRPIEHDPAYLRYLCASELFCQQVNKLAWGIAYPAISESLMGKIKVPVPPKEEQRAIAALLDEKCAAIDATANTLETQISTLERYRASVIHEAVTRGLDPTAPTKPSNVDWIGNIPQNWEIKKLKHLVLSFESGTSVRAASYPAGRGEKGVLSLSSVFGGQYDSSANKRIDDDELTRASCPVKSGSLLVSRCNTSEWVGLPAFVEQGDPNLYLPDKLWQIDCGSPLFNKFVWYALHSKGSRDYCAVMSVGSSSSMQNIASFDLLNMYIPVPQGKEDILAVVTFLDSKLPTIDAVIDTKRKQLDVLKRRRQSLIYEYVTGKRRVSEEA